MIVGGNNQIQNLLKVYGDQKKVSQTKADKVNSAMKQDEVILSPQAQEFAHFLQAVSNSSDVRADKVQSVTNQIAAGQYQISAQAIAGKLWNR